MFAGPADMEVPFVLDPCFLTEKGSAEKGFAAKEGLFFNKKTRFLRRIDIWLLYK